MLSCSRSARISDSTAMHACNFKLAYIPWDCWVDFGKVFPRIFIKKMFLCTSLSTEFSWGYALFIDTVCVLLRLRSTVS